MRRIIFILGTLLATIAVSAQQTVTVQAQSYQVSDNLDLEAVAITFGESKNVEDFERRLNDPENRISNLDLNNDGYVDFLRAVELEDKGTHMVVIQAVIGQDLYQDVATVIVEGETKTSATVTIVGNRNIYGDNYVIVPRYTVRPVIFDWFWLPTYVVYRSLWYWDYYPHYYHHYTCLGYHSYHRYIHTWHTHHHHHCDFHRPVEYHHHNHHVEMHRTIARNDYATQRPNQGYRAEQTPNRHIEARPVTTTTQARPSTQPTITSTNRGRQSGSVSTSSNRVERPSTSISSRATTNNRAITSTTPRSITTSTTNARPATSSSRQTTTTVRPTTSTSRNTSTTRTTSTAVRNTTTKATSTSIVKPRTTTSTSRSTSTSVRPSTSTTRSISTAVRPSTSTSRKVSTSSTSVSTTSTLKTNKNTSTSRR